MVTPAVWMDVGLSSNNTRLYINISQLVGYLDVAVIDALPALHAFTGSDYAASFTNKGKLRPLDLVIKHPTFTAAFASFGRSDMVEETVTADIEKFTCTLYGMHRHNNINEVRLALFQQKYAPKQPNQPLDKIKGINPSSMPPCKHVLYNKFRKTNYITHMWKHATDSNPCTLDAEGHGWSLVQGKYIINWFDCNQLPESFMNIIGNSDLSFAELGVNAPDHTEEAASYSSDEIDDDETY